jgi:hypothetical protein
MPDKTPDSQPKSPSGAEPHNSYGLAPKSEGEEQPKTASKPQDPKSDSQSPSGAEPHNSYGVTPTSNSGSADSSNKDNNLKSKI